MRETLHAAFESVEIPAQETEDLIELAARVYDGLTDDQIDEIERMALDRSNFFGDGYNR